MPSSIVGLIALVVMAGAVPVAGAASPQAPEPERVEIFLAEPGSVPGEALDAVPAKALRYASLYREAAELCAIYRGRARLICVDEARFKYGH